MQTPAWQVSACVQASPSLQATPVNSVQAPFAAAPAAREQASQGPALQAVLQQTPSTQKPLWQSVARPQALPSGFGFAYRRALDRFPLSQPPVTSTSPLLSRVAACQRRMSVSPAHVHVSVTGSYSSESPVGLPV